MSLLRERKGRGDNKPAFQKLTVTSLETDLTERAGHDALADPALCRVKVIRSSCHPRSPAVTSRTFY